MADRFVRGKKVGADLRAARGPLGDWSLAALPRPIPRTSLRHVVRVMFAMTLAAGATAVRATEPATFDIVVYGGTSGGIAAAVESARRGHSVVLIEPGRRLGGMTTNGLGATDMWEKDKVGGFAREFYAAIYAHYERPDAWRYETRDEYRPKHRDALAEDLRLQFFFEPSVALRILEQRLQSAGVTVWRGERLLRPGGAQKRNNRLTAIELESGRRVAGCVFIDASYEGDLLAEAGVSYVTGREARREFDERLAGITYLPLARTAHLDPFRARGEAGSGLLPGVEPTPPGAEGEGDHRAQAYTFRVCLTDVPENRVEIARPANYDPLRYELLARHLEKYPQQTIGPRLFKLTPMPNRKTDSNNQGLLSTDFVGASHAWAEASYAERERLWQAHRDYVQGFFWFLQNDERVPAAVREQARRWGLAKDEFVETDNWPSQLYVREARRMRGDYVVTEHDCTGRRIADDPVALGAYALDSHQVTYFIDAEKRLRGEGAFWFEVPPYGISRRALQPREAECANLLVPVCVSATHVAYGSLRMEPVFMMLGQASALLASLAIEQDTSVQCVRYEALRPLLEEAGLPLSAPKAEMRPTP